MKAILFVLLFMISFIVSGQDPPSGYTTYYGLRMWAEDENPSADSLNANWQDIDNVLYDLITYADPRYFAWNATEDTLTINTYAFGTLGFGANENLYLPNHDPPFTYFGGSSIAYTTGGWVTFNNSAQSRYDTLSSHVWVRNYIESGGDAVTIGGVQTITGAKTFQGAVLFSSKDGRLVLPDYDVGFNTDSEGQIAYDFSSNELVIYNGSSYDTYASQTWAYATFSEPGDSTWYHDFYTTTASPSYREGRMFYDSLNRSFTYYVEEPDVSMQVGREMWLRGLNSTGDSIVNGTPVIGIAPGTIVEGDADADSTSRLIGVVTHTIEDGTYGYITSYGVVRNMNTSALSVGPVYLAAGGGLTSTAPSAPNNSIRIGAVGVVDATNGLIFVDVPHFNDVNGIATISFADESEIIDATSNVQVTNATDDLFIYDTSVGHDITLSGDTLYVAYDGVYTLSISVSFGGGNGGQYKFTLKHNSTIIPNHAAERKTTSADVGSLSLDASADMDGGDVITLWVEDLGTSPNITMIHCTIVMTQVR